MGARYSGYKKSFSLVAWNARLANLLGLLMQATNGV